MNSKFKSFLINFTKQAVNAALISLAPVIATPVSYNLTTASGLRHVAILVGGAIGSRELLVWIPVLMKWSQSNGNGNGSNGNDNSIHWNQGAQA